MRRMTIHRAERLAKMDEHPNSMLKDVALSCLATFSSIAICSGLFLWRSQYFLQWRQVRTEFAFTPVYDSYTLAIIWVLMGFTAIGSRSWIAPVGVGFILTMYTLFGWSWSGPGYLLKAIEPLLFFRSDMKLLAAAINSALLIYWVCREKRRTSAPKRSEAGFAVLTIGRPITGQNVAELDED